ncbi:MAG: hypothetical protein ACI8RT_000748 [Candidatus Azotimanducaceae bacterium]
MTCGAYEYRKALNAAEMIDSVKIGAIYIAQKKNKAKLQQMGLHYAPCFIWMLDTDEG